MLRPFVLAALLCWPAAAAAQRLRIEVGGPNFRPYPVAVPEPVVLKPGGIGRLVKELGNILQVGVDLSRSMELVPPASYLADDKEPWANPEFGAWLNVGASGLIRCGLEAAPDDKVKIGLRFFDVVGQREVLYRNYEEKADNAGRAVYRFLDEVVELLTGEKGIYSTRLALVKKTKGGKAVFVADIDGRNEERLSDPDALGLLPSWDLTGRFIYFTSYIQNNPDLYRLRVADQHLEPLSSRRGLNTGAALSPDGKKIALTLSIDGNTEVYVMDASGDNVKRLTDNWGQDISPTWSPDGKKIAFVSSRSGQPHIFIMNADGSAPTRLTFQGTYNQEPDWSPRPGGQIAFTARDEFLKFDIFLVNPTSGVVTRLTQDEGNNQSPSHSPDGHHIVFVSTRPPRPGSKLYIMDVDGANQRRISRTEGEYETPAWGPRVPWP